MTDKGSTRFEDIPKEIMRNVVLGLSTRERQLIRSLSRNCKEAVELYFGIRVILTDENYKSMMHCDRHCYKDVTLKNLTIPMNLDSHRISQSLLPGLEKLEIQGKVTPHNLNAVLTHCHNLEILTFTENQVEGSDMAQFYNILEALTFDPARFPKLTSLNITYYRRGGLRDEDYFHTTAEDDGAVEEIDFSIPLEHIFGIRERHMRNQEVQMNGLDGEDPENPNLEDDDEPDFVDLEDQRDDEDDDADDESSSDDDEIRGARIGTTAVILFQILKKLFKSQNLSLMTLESDENSMTVVLDGQFYPALHLVEVMNIDRFGDPMTQGWFRYMCEEDKTVYQIIQDNIQTLQNISFTERLEPFSPNLTYSFKLHAPSTLTLGNETRWLPQVSEMTCPQPVNQWGWNYALTTIPRLLTTLQVHQSNVNSLKVASSYYNQSFANPEFFSNWANCFPTIIAFRNTLRIFHLYYYHFHLVVDFNDLRDCSVLAEVAIMQHPNPGFINSPSYTFVKNITGLPPSVEVLRLSAVILFTETEFSRVSFGGLNLLKEFELYSKPWFSLGGYEVYEMKMQYVNYMLQALPRLRLIRLQIGKYYDVPEYQNFTFDTVSEEFLQELRDRQGIDTEIEDGILTLMVRTPVTIEAIGHDVME